MPNGQRRLELPASGIGKGVARDEDQLKVAGREFRRRPDMGDRFHATVGELAALAKQPLQQPFRVRRVRQADEAGGESPDRPRMRVVGEALADARAVDERGDPDAAQMIRRTDARQLQQVWRAIGAGAHDDLAVGERPAARRPRRRYSTPTARPSRMITRRTSALVTTVRFFWPLR